MSVVRCYHRLSHYTYITLSFATSSVALRHLLLEEKAFYCHSGIYATNDRISKYEQARLYHSFQLLLSNKTKSQTVNAVVRRL